MIIQIFFQGKNKRFFCDSFANVVLQIKRVGFDVFFELFDFIEDDFDVVFDGVFFEIVVVEIAFGFEVVSRGSEIRQK